MRIQFSGREAVLWLFTGALLIHAGASAVSGYPGPGGPGEAGDAPFAITIAHTAAGDALTGPDGMTLYTRTQDEGSASGCTSGKCALAWPALKGYGSEIQPGPGVSGTFGTTTWSDGTNQVTYNGRPLYYFSLDKALGDAKGNGRNDAWFIASVGGAAGCGPAAPSEESPASTFRAPGPAIHASENSDGEY
ncbi:MAG: hypothetical protein ABIR64_06350 [Candidatus Limnocylindrales bacterium]